MSGKGKPVGLRRPLIQFGRGFMATFLCVYVVMIGVPIARSPLVTTTTTTQNAAPTTQADQTNVTKKETQPFVDPASQQQVKVEPGADPGTLKIDFPAGTTPFQATAAIGDLDSRW